MTRTIRHLLTCIVLLLSAAACAKDNGKPASEAVSSPRDLLDIRAVTGLLDLLDTLVAHSPDMRELNLRLSASTPSEQDRILDSLTQRNAANPQINHQIDALLSLPAYRLYYKQFSNMTPEKHREIFDNLPYRDIGGPADISTTMRELVINRRAVRDWINGVVDSIDLNHSNRIALQWVPPGDYTMPPIHFIYDGNGDAFAREGEVTFDLWGIVFSKRSTQTRFYDLTSVGVAQIEGVLAHEMQHIYAEPYLYPKGLTFDTWQDQWIDRITRRFVSEGVAMQCDVHAGFRWDSMEDTAVVRYWLGHLNAKFAALKNGTIDQPAFEAWYHASYYDSARAALERFGKSAYPETDLRQFLAEHLGDRPTFDYTLGWWMVSHIRAYDGRDTVIALLSDPSRVYALYNATIPPEDTDLKVDF